jgi:hypothetical protein
MKKPAYMTWVLCVVLAAAAPGLFAEGKEGKPPAHPASAAAPKAPPPKAGQAPGNNPNAGRPVYPLDRWAAMNPAQREALMSKMTPERRANLEKRLAKWQSMPEAQKERVRNLTPAQRQILTAHAQWMQTLPPERRQAIRHQINMFEQMSPEARQAELNSPSFSRKYDPVERDHIQKVVSTMPKDE